MSPVATFAGLLANPLTVVTFYGCSIDQSLMIQKDC